MSYQLPKAGHGSRSAYTWGCRCDECRAANTRYYHQRKARMTPVVVQSQPQVEVPRRSEDEVMLYRNPQWSKDNIANRSLRGGASGGSR